MPPGSVPLAFVGTWEGTGHQADNTSWTMSMRISGGRGPLVGRISYQQGCSGTLELIKVGTRSLELRETIYTNVSRCVATGRIAVELRSDGRLDWFYRSTDPRSHARSVLRRKR